MLKTFPDNILDMIVQFEVGNKKRYQKKFIEPWYANQRCGIIIGIIYDLGAVSDGEFTTDWKEYINEDALKVLREAVGFRGAQAQQISESIRNIQIPYDAAVQVFK